MKFSLIPDYSFNKLTDIAPGFLLDKGISFLMLDLDNTISPYGVTVPDEKILSWAENMRSSGVELYIVSNSKRPNRTEGFADKLGIGYIKAAGKPRPGALIQLMETKELSPEKCAIAGDQIYTDVIAGNLAGVTSFVLYPIKFTNPFLRIRYWAEIPFRLMCRNKMWRNNNV